MGKLLNEREASLVATRKTLNELASKLTGVPHGFGGVGTPLAVLQARGVDPRQANSTIDIAVGRLERPNATRPIRLGHANLIVTG